MIVVRHLRDDKLTPVQRYRDAVPRSGCLAYDGLYLWTCDPEKKLLNKHIIDSRLTIVATYPYAGGTPAALTYDGRSLWSLDSENRELLRHNLDDPTVPMERRALPEYRLGTYQASGLAWDGKRFWTIGEKLPAESGPARVFSHSLRDVSGGR